MTHDKMAELLRERDAKGTSPVRRWEIGQELLKALPVLLEQHAKMAVEFDWLGNAATKNERFIDQMLGRALGYPEIEDEHGGISICTGDNTSESLAMEAAERIFKLTADNAKLAAELEKRRAVEAREWGDGRQWAE